MILLFGCFVEMGKDGYGPKLPPVCQEPMYGKMPRTKSLALPLDKMPLDEKPSLQIQENKENA